MDRYEKTKEILEKSQEANSNGILMSYRVKTMKDERVCSDCLKFEGYTASVSEAIMG